MADDVTLHVLPSSPNDLPAYATLSTLTRPPPPSIAPCPTYQSVVKASAHSSDMWARIRHASALVRTSLVRTLTYFFFFSLVVSLSLIVPMLVVKYVNLYLLANNFDTQNSLQRLSNLTLFNFTWSSWI